RSVPGLGEGGAPADARRADGVLRGRTGAGRGMIAAATMGLPERAKRGRDYDYRYVWIREQCYAGQAVATDGPRPAPAYTIEGDRVPDQRRVSLPGYPGGTDVIGNHA